MARISPNANTSTRLRVWPERLAMLALALLALPALAQGRVDRPGGLAGTRPNIILVFCDDLGYAELGCYGQERIQTPSIDRLADEGLRLTRFYSASTVCAPARCAIMTGYHTGHGVIRGNREVGGWGPEEPEGQWPLPDAQVTLAEVLRGVGYSTACIGKWGLGGPGSEGHPSRQGFDHFYGYLCQRVAHNLYPTHLWRNHDVDVLRNDYFPAHQRLDAVPEGWTSADWDQYRGPDFAPGEMLDEAVRWIERHAQRGRDADGSNGAHGSNDPHAPFFLYFSTILPHAALQAPQEFVDRYPREWDQPPLGGAYLGQQGYLPCERPRATYAAMIEYIDHSVGRLREAVEAAGLGDNTLIIVTSDNGTTFNGGVDRAFFDSLGGLRGFKTNLYEGGIRVPFVAWWPGRIAPGTTRDEVVGLYDLMPTLCAIGGAAPPARIDGVSLAGLLGGAALEDHPGYVYIEYPEAAQQQCVIVGDIKGIRPRLREDGREDGREGRRPTIEIYDLSTDPFETRDLAALRPDLVELCESIMDREHVASALFPIPAID
ncbi:MAG: arylsulfatase [Phycisphaeraceae bacterium]|nr:arylsulfatase [Phycisphaeraceae bacterium]